jgi:sterol desaturase/sphingolipid hydroxylase (fatty acid hydroxylase superfamily)
MSEQHQKKAKGTPRKVWNYTPALPLELAPYWQWPMKPLASARYLLQSWNPIAQRCLILIFAVITWAWFTPDLKRAETISLDWVFEIWLRNLIILSSVAGGLHLFLVKYRKQKDEYRYDMRPMMKGAKIFSFKNQVYDNMFWSLGPALIFWTFWESMILWAYANGWATMIRFDESPTWFISLVLLIPLWAGFHFYWLHRLLHVGQLYTRFHSWHHKNINTGPWSGLAMHPVESFFLMFDTMIFFIVASHPIHAIFLLFHHGIGAPVSHAGFENLKLSNGRKFLLGDFYHQLHHKFFDCNYGTWETPWDKWFNTFHNGTSEGDQLVRNRRRKILARK